jgi:hypothetical protein
MGDIPFAACTAARHIITAIAADLKEGAASSQGCWFRYVELSFSV